MAGQKPPIWNLPTVNKNHLQCLTEEELFNSCKLIITMSYNHANKFTELMAFDYRQHIQQVVADHLAAFKQQYPIKCSSGFEAKMVQEAKSHALSWKIIKMPKNLIANNAAQPISSPNNKNASNFIGIQSNPNIHNTQNNNNNNNNNNGSSNNNNIFQIPSINNNNTNMNNINSSNLNQSGANNITILPNSNNNNAFSNMPHFLSRDNSWNLNNNNIHNNVSLPSASMNISSSYHMPPSNIVNNTVASNSNILIPNNAILNGNNNIKNEIIKIEPPSNSQQNTNPSQSDDDSDCQIISVLSAQQNNENIATKNDKKRSLQQMEDNDNLKPKSHKKRKRNHNLSPKNASNNNTLHDIGKYPNARSGPQFDQILKGPDKLNTKNEKYWEPESCDELHQSLNRIGCSIKKLSKNSRVFKTFLDHPQFKTYCIQSILYKEEEQFEKELRSNSNLSFIIFCTLGLEKELKDLEKLKNNNDNNDNDNNDNDKKHRKKPIDHEQRVQAIMKKINYLRENNKQSIESEKKKYPKLSVE